MSRRNAFLVLGVVFCIEIAALVIMLQLNARIRALGVEADRLSSDTRSLNDELKALHNELIRDGGGGR